MKQNQIWIQEDKAVPSQSHLKINRVPHPQIFRNKRFTACRAGHLLSIKIDTLGLHPVCVMERCLCALSHLIIINVNEPFKVLSTIHFCLDFFSCRYPAFSLIDNTFFGSCRIVGRKFVAANGTHVVLLYVSWTFRHSCWIQ